MEIALSEIVMALFVVVWGLSLASGLLGYMWRLWTNIYVMVWNKHWCQVLGYCRPYPISIKGDTTLAYTYALWVQNTFKHTNIKEGFKMQYQDHSSTQG